MIPNVKEMVIKILMKWVTVPISFLVIALTGAAVDMPFQFEKTKDKHEIVLTYGVVAVYLGLYSGVIAGIMVDKMSNLISYLIAAVLSLIAFISAAFLHDGEGIGINIGLLVCCFLAGISGSIGVITSVVSLAKNFDAGNSGLLLVSIAVTYWKLADGMD
jgi:MFS family permease